MTEVEEYKSNSIENDTLRAIGCINASKLNLEKCDEISDEYSHYLPSLEFVLSQLENLLYSKNRRIYNLITMILALKCQIISPSCYKFFRDKSVSYFPITTPTSVLHKYWIGKRIYILT